MIDCRNLVKSFGDNDVIRGISLKLADGKITSLVGKNGAGKSTLIGLIVAYYQLNSGSVKKGTISIMPDADNMYPSWTGIEFLTFISKLKKVDISEAIGLAKELGIEKNLKKKITSFSFGMKKKLSFIQCAIGQYETYIFDEPTSGVDVPSALIMLDIIKRLKSNGSAVLLTSHNIDELERVSDYIYIIENGKIIQEGTVSDIVNKKKELIYILVSSQINLIANLDLVRNYLHSIHEDSIELLFSNESQASETVRELVLTYPIREFYQKKNSLIASVYNAHSD